MVEYLLIILPFIDPIVVLPKCILFDEAKTSSTYKDLHDMQYFLNLVPQISLGIRL